MFWTLPLGYNMHVHCATQTKMQKVVRVSTTTDKSVSGRVNRASATEAIEAGLIPRLDQTKD